MLASGHERPDPIRHRARPGRLPADRAAPVARRPCRRSGRALHGGGIVAEARSRRLGVGRATVFRTLEVFEELGVIERLDLPSGEHAYVGCEPVHHHHVVCSRCGRTTEIDDAGLRRVVRDVARRTGFRVDEHRLELFGVCPACLGARRARPVSRPDPMTTSRTRRRRVLAAALAVSMLIVAACGADGAGRSGRLRRRLALGRWRPQGRRDDHRLRRYRPEGRRRSGRRSSSIIPAGAGPEDYEPKPRRRPQARRTPTSSSPTASGSTTSSTS